VFQINNRFQNLDTILLLTKFL